MEFGKFGEGKDVDVVVAAAATSDKFNCYYSNEFNMIPLESISFSSFSNLIACGDCRILAVR